MASPAPVRSWFAHAWALGRAWARAPDRSRAGLFRAALSDPVLLDALVAVGLPVGNASPAIMAHAMFEPAFRHKDMLAAMRPMLGLGLDPDCALSAEYPSMGTALHVACRNAWLDTTRTLLEMGANPNARDSTGETPLYFAISHDNTPVKGNPAHRPAIVLALLAAGARADGFVSNGKLSPLALCPLDLPLLKGLIAAGADPECLFNPHTGKWGSFNGVAPRPPRLHLALLFRAVELADVPSLGKFLDFMAAHGQGPHTRNGLGQPLIHVLVSSRGLSPCAHGALEVLASRGHDLAALDGEGNNVFHALATQEAHSAPWLESLLDRPGVAPLVCAPNAEGKLPVDVARERQGALLQMLESATSAQSMEAVLPSPSPRGSLPFRPRM